MLCTVSLFFVGCSTPQLAGKAPVDGELAAMPKPAQVDSGQLLVVIGEGKGNFHARLYALEREGSGWRRYLGPVRAVVGRNGFAASGEKVEGDGKTPSGIFPLELVFGYDPASTIRMPYRQATAADLWVDDVDSPDYNTWVRRGDTAAKSYEVMRLPDRRYRHGIVIGYNRYPIVKGKGSAIFVHVWGESEGPTAGCVALDEGQLVAIIDWLDPAQKPMIVMGNEGTIDAIFNNAGKTGAP